MIAYTMMLLTDLEDVNKADFIRVQCGTGVVQICGEAVRGFVVAANKAFKCFPGEDCLGQGLELIQPELRPVFEYLYEELCNIVT